MRAGHIATAQLAMLVICILAPVLSSAAMDGDPKLSARVVDGRVRVNWRMGYNYRTASFNLYRRSSSRWIRINSQRLPAHSWPDARKGEFYEIEDPEAVPGVPADYILVEHTTAGSARSYGPLQLTPQEFKLRVRKQNGERAQVGLTWPSHEGLSYRILKSVRLDSGFYPLASGIAGLESETTFVDEGSEAFPTFYRVAMDNGSEVWRSLDFDFPVQSSPPNSRLSATIEDGLLHMIDAGTQSGDLWSFKQYWNASPETGAAVEARVRTVSCVGVAGVMLGLSDGEHEDILTLYPDRIELYRSGLSYAMDTTAAYHVYRIDIQGQDIRVAVDGETVINGPGAFTYPAYDGRNRLSYGAGSSASTGEAYWDWLRWRVTMPERAPGEHGLMNVEHAMVHKDGDRYACFPGLSIDPDSEFLYTRFTSKERATHHTSPDSRSVYMESQDGGTTWQEVPSIPSTVHSDRPGPTFTGSDGALIRMRYYGWRWYPNERLPEFEGQYRITPGSETLGPGPDYFATLTGGYVQRSDNGGQTWQTTAIPGVDTYASFSSPWSCVPLPDGGVLRTFMVLHGAEQERQVYAVVTRDGLSTEMTHVMGAAPGDPQTFTEETLVHVTSEGIIWMLTRVHGGGDFMWQAISEDGGATWTSAPTTINVGQSPPSGLVELDDGRLVLIMGYRKEPYGIRALVSDDEGLTWRMDHEIILRDDGAGYDLGYPRAIKLADGSVLAIYYYHTEDAVRHIACTRFRVPAFD